MPRSGPLNGLTVVELAGLGPAPFAGMALADMGADVITVGRPAPVSDADVSGDVVERGKRSVVLDLKDPAAQARLLDLLETADVFIEGFRPGVTERLGLGPAEVWARNPRLVYARMTGWGQDGPLSQTAGHDIDYIAITGALHAIGPAGGPPVIPLNLVGDVGGGSTYLVMGILAALLEAQRTQLGQVVDAAIVDGASHLLALIHGLHNRGAWRPERSANALDGGWPFYSVYETSDGRHMAVGALEAKFFAELIRLLELDFDVTRQNDPAGWPVLRAQLTAAFAARTQADWTALFEGTDACVAPVLSLAEAVRHPHIAARGSLQDSGGQLQPGPAPRFSRHPVEPPGRVPRSGEHTAEVLGEPTVSGRPA